ncbi:MAG: phosphate uptake regulator PhoU [Thermoplasmatales archaeon]|nr:MAG: phosphate uptake regulator PhoU [Thermoplasmatales archaeon]
MEIRRVQVTGGSSYIVTLPKEWIKKANIQKNDSIGLVSQSDGTLLITPKMIEKQSQKIKTFQVDDKTDQKFILRQLVGAYIAGYNSIEIVSAKKMPSKIRDSIRKFTQITIGQEVIEETDSSIILKDLLNPTEMPFNSTIKRMHILVKNMHEDSINALMISNKKIQEEILLRDNDVDRLYWLVARQHNILLQNVNLAEKMGITFKMSLACFLISKKIERMGDHVVNIAQNVSQMVSNDLNEGIVAKIQSASDLALDIFNSSIGAFFRKDIVESNRNIDSVKKLEKKCEEINKLVLNKKGNIAISIGNIIESIKRMGEYAEDISETTINYIIGESQEKN